MAVHERVHLRSSHNLLSSHLVSLLRALVPVPSLVIRRIFAQPVQAPGTHLVHTRAGIQGARGASEEAENPVVVGFSPSCPPTPEAASQAEGRGFEARRPFPSHATSGISAPQSIWVPCGSRLRGPVGFPDRP